YGVFTLCGIYSTNVQLSRLLPRAPRDVEEIGQDFELPKKLVISDDLDILQIGSPTFEGSALWRRVQFLGAVTGDHHAPRHKGLQFLARALRQRADVAYQRF